METNHQVHFLEMEKSLKSLQPKVKNIENNAREIEETYRKLIPERKPI